jgi:hypothetical protein
MNRHAKKSVVVVALALATSVVAACKGGDAPPPAIDEQGAVREQHANAVVTFLVTPDGAVWARVKRGDTVVDPEKMEGRLRVQPLGRETAPAEHKLAKKADLLHADIGKLDGELTEIAYDVSVGDTAMQGILHVPSGGTKELVENAAVAAKADIKADVKGPHGGVVQVVGEHVVEIVGKKDSGEVRVFLLDDDRKAVAIGRQRVKLAVVGGKSEVLELKVDEKKQYFYGTLGVKSNPSKITVVVDEGNDVDVALVGYAPGSVVVVGPSAPVVAVFVVERWDVVVVDAPTAIVVKTKGKGKGKKGHVHVNRGGVHVKVK